MPFAYVRAIFSMLSIWNPLFLYICLQIAGDQNAVGPLFANGILASAILLIVEESSNSPPHFYTLQSGQTIYN